MERVIGLLDAPLRRRVADHQRRRHEAHAAATTATTAAGATAQPSRIGEGRHGNAPARVDGEQALAQGLGGRADAGPGLPLQPEVALLDPAHDGGGGVLLRAAAERRQTGQQRVLK